MTLKINGKKIFNRFASIFLFSVAFFLFAYIIIPNYNGKTVAVILLFSIGILPNIVLLIEYLIHTIKINSVEFSDHEFQVLYKDGRIGGYNYSEIKIIKLYKAAGMDKGNYSFNSNEKFYFAKIIGKDGKNIILTSLLGPNLSDALDMLKAVPIDRTKTGYAFIFLNHD